MRWSTRRGAKQDRVGVGFARSRFEAECEAKREYSRLADHEAEKEVLRGPVFQKDKVWLRLKPFLDLFVGLEAGKEPSK